MAYNMQCSLGQSKFYLDYYIFVLFCAFGSKFITVYKLCIFWFCQQVIQVNLTQEDLQPIKAGKKIDLTYAVHWEPTNTSFIRRFDAYLDYPFFEHQVCQSPLCTCQNISFVECGLMLNGYLILLSFSVYLPLIFNLNFIWLHWPLEQ